MDFAEGVVSGTDTLEEIINSTLNYHAEMYGIELKERLLNLKLKELVRKTSEKYASKVVVLIDEYDKPILDRI
ncbi:MAG: AAA family ATPase, partial [Thermodesulforhabdaceae bacterium]